LRAGRVTGAVIGGIATVCLVGGVLFLLLGTIKS
jgi:hypothetical protein